MEITDNFKAHLEQMEDRLTDMESKIDVIDTKLTQVVDAILGNPLTKIGGLMQDIDIMKQKIEVLEKSQLQYENFKNRVYWTIGIVVGVALVLQYFVNVYYNIKRN
jgi:prefoldin subunit 5